MTTVQRGQGRGSRVRSGSAVPMPAAVSLPSRTSLSPVFWVLFWGTLVNRAASFVVVFLALHLTQDLGLSKATAGWIVGSWGIGSGVAIPVAGGLPGPPRPGGPPAAG